jgi:alkylated DNA repair dioxygenase AlkB
MDFFNLMNGNKLAVLLEPCSAVILTGPSRYEWTHGIATRKTDSFHSKKIARKLRVSLTFRKVII